MYNIVKFASYSFNKSHAAAYALISYRTAYLKKYYPVEFMTAVISSNTNDPEKMGFYIEAARNMDITILPPEINFSDRDFSVETSHRGKCIRFGLSGIHAGWAQDIPAQPPTGNLRSSKKSAISDPTKSGQGAGFRPGNCSGAARRWKSNHVSAIDSPIR